MTQLKEKVIEIQAQAVKQADMEEIIKEKLIPVVNKIE